MTTRAQVFITEEFTEDDGFISTAQYFNYYHHCDGYLEGVGYEIYNGLLQTLETMDENAHIINQFANNLEIHAMLGQYEHEHDCDQAHSDVEVIYNVRFAEDNVYIFVTQYDFENGWITDCYDLDHLAEIFDSEPEVE